MKNHLSRCLKSIESIDYPREKYEIIVIDNGSTDGTEQICKDFNIKYFFQKRRTRGHARNVGINYSKGEIIAFVDADCEVERNWLKVHVRDHLDDSIGSVAGAVINPFMKSSNGIGIAAHIEEFADFDENLPKRSTYHVACCNASFKKNLLIKVGYFDETLHAGEDTLLSQKIADLDFSLLFDPTAIVFHYGIRPNMSFGDYLKKEIQFGKAYFKVQIRNKNIIRRLPTNRISILLFAPSIIVVRILKEIYKIRSSHAFANPFVLPIIVIGGFIWGSAYIKEALLSDSC
ncbi:glycosyltransferase [Candidatus Dojkabacteria bacterium]|nr:glycosyltransferase [Candidatus Dojkabacteria bacterium]